MHRLSANVNKKSIRVMPVLAHAPPRLVTAQALSGPGGAKLRIAGDAGDLILTSARGGPSRGVHRLRWKGDPVRIGWPEVSNCRQILGDGHRGGVEECRGPAWKLAQLWRCKRGGAAGRAAGRGGGGEMSQSRWRSCVGCAARRFRLVVPL